VRDTRTETIRDIREFLRRERWVLPVEDVTFLAAGEYNENYTIRSGDQAFVFRINQGTQLGLDDQIGYEFTVLEAVYPSGCTPRPLHLCRSDQAFPRGAMLMEYVPGATMDYRRDWKGAAELFARIHALAPSERLIAQMHPIRDIVAESRGLLDRYPEHPRQEVGDTIRRYADVVEKLGERTDALMHADRLCMVNTEVNSGNFIRARDRLVLVDWEKAVVSYRYQDLGHFLVPTTTLWKSNFRFDPDTRREFLLAYLAAAGHPVPFDEADRLTGALEQTIVLRGLSWCYMAFAEYTRSDRTLRNTNTFRTITRYLENAEQFIGAAGGA
jgi:aminoglycoside phosphotransferase (APT) family kinase protein